ncbi:sigma-70 family RNA polymerase sigma factor [Streptomyces boncukensis]|uniref:Sigma-70 family RNA polymerase sigma factor n=1 Tax=Streptomyces boncukensis TaxID=2711219 RepID=A0A6G4WWF5_9ACTN|nr:sigma-70 family RNA polymerase sigma factor [Streptomyces boncukensis]
MTDTLEALVARAAAGGDDAPDALSQVYDQLNDTVYRWVRYFIRDAHVAEDVCQEIWIKVARNISRYRPGTNLLGWLHTIARNASMDYLRSVQRRPSEVLCADHLALDRPRHGQGPEEHAEHRALAQAVAARLAQLRPEQRQCLRLRFFDGLSPAHTAQIMGKTEGAVRTLTVRSLRKLSEVLPNGDSSGDIVEELLTAAVGKRRVAGAQETRKAGAHG